MLDAEVVAMTDWAEMPAPSPEMVAPGLDQMIGAEERAKRIETARDAWYDGEWAKRIETARDAWYDGEWAFDPEVLRPQDALIRGLDRIFDARLMRFRFPAVMGRPR